MFRACFVACCCCLRPCSLALKSNSIVSITYKQGNHLPPLYSMPTYTHYSNPITFHHQTHQHKHKHKHTPTHTHTQGGLRRHAVAHRVLRALVRCLPVGHPRDEEARRQPAGCVCFYMSIYMLIYINVNYTILLGLSSSTHPSYSSPLPHRQREHRSGRRQLRGGGTL